MTSDAGTLAEVGRRAGLCAVGFCSAEPFERTAETLQQRKAAGLHGGMQFTYRNPQRSTDPARLLRGAASLVVGALAFDAADEPPPGDASPFARVAAYARRDYYAQLRTALEAIAAALRGDGHKAVVTADDNALVDRAAAHRSGIGWWGKNSNILVPGAGSLVVLGSVVTDAVVVAADPEPVADGCGTCQQCLDGCPTGAIVAPGVVDARRCLAWLVQADGVFDRDHRAALGDRIYGCDDCSEVCPPNRLTIRRSPAEAREPVADGWVPVLDVLEASDSELLDTYGRWYIPRRQPRYLRRNALIVLGNVADPSDPRVRAAVDRALGDSDPLMRAHAVWCARRLGMSLDALAGRDDPLVRAELQRPVEPRTAA